MTNPSLAWNQPGWLNDAQAWIYAALDSHNIRPTGAIEQFHIRPWSTVLRVLTEDGIIYFKATAPTLGYEPALTAFLAQLRPDVLPDILAVDPERGWMLMRDCGTPLRVFIKAEKSIERWRGILPLYVELQKEMMPRVRQILALGVLDRRLDNLPIQFELLVVDAPSMLVDQTDGLTSEEYQRLKASVRAFERMCVELDSLGIPATLHHDDFHDGNLFLQNGQVRFTDWGESAVTHPFFTLVVLLRGASNSLDLASDAFELAQMRNWYLSQWTEYASRTNLEPMVYLAQQIGLVNRALTWHRVISSLPENLKPEYATAVPAYLQEFINTQNES